MANKKSSALPIILVLLLIGIASFGFYKLSVGQFVYTGGELGYTIAQGSEFDSNNLDSKYWQIEGSPASTAMLPGGGTWCWDSNGGAGLLNRKTDPNTGRMVYGAGTCVNRPDTMNTAYNRFGIDTTNHDLIVLLNGNLRTTVSYMNYIPGRDYIINIGLLDTGTAVFINVANCAGAGGSIASQGALGFDTDLLSNQNVQFKIVSSRLDPSKAVLMTNGKETCQIDASQTGADMKGKIHLSFQTSPKYQGSQSFPSKEGIFALHPILESIPFTSCSINNGSGELMVSEVIPAGKKFDKFSLSLPPEKFCINFGAYLYDPTRGFDVSPEVYQKLQSGEQLNYPYDIKLVYVVYNKDPTTNGTRYGQYPSSCGNGLIVDTASKKCEPIGGFVDLCRTGELDVQRGACIQYKFDNCTGVIIEKDGVRSCNVFLPDISTLCAPGSIIINGTGKGTCVAPKFDCGEGFQLVKVSPSEFKCVSLQPLTQPVTQSNVPSPQPSVNVPAGTTIASTTQSTTSSWGDYFTSPILIGVLALVLAGVVGTVYYQQKKKGGKNGE